MNLLQNIVSGAAVCLWLTTGAWAQTNYRPGQTFSAGSAATPTPAVQVLPEANLPVYAPAQQQRVQPQQVRTQPRVQENQLYNMPAKQTKPAATSKKATSSKAASSRVSESENKKNTSEKTPKKVAVPDTEEVAEKAAEPAPSTAIAKAAAAASKSLTSSETAEVEESVKEQAAETKAEVAVASSGSSSTLPSNDKLVFSEHSTGKKLIALTYDDGPNPAFTPRLVEYLKANNVAATFYLCGNMVKEYPDAVKQLAAEGFELANHSYDHPNLQKLSREKIVSQLQDTHDLIKEYTGVDVKTMRPPYGAMNGTVKEVCEAMGYKIILWDVDTEDWRKRSTSQMMNTISKLTGDGSIILMHDRKHGGQDTVLETTRQTVEKYRAHGYKFVTVTELLGLNETAKIKGPLTVPGPLTAAANVSSTATATLAGAPVPAAVGAAPVQSMP